MVYDVVECEDVVEARQHTCLGGVLLAMDEEGVDG